MRTVSLCLVGMVGAFIGASFGHLTTMNQVKEGHVRTAEANYACWREVVHQGNEPWVTVVEPKVGEP